MSQGQYFTLGIEEEFQLIDPETRDLRSHIQEIYADGKDALGEQIKPELHQSVVEVGTVVCADIKEARAEVLRLRSALAGVARGQGLRIGAAGTHPFARWQDQKITVHPRYAEIVEDLQDVARANLMAARAPVTDAVYNIGSGSEVSLKECAELMLETMGARLPIQYAPARKVNPVPRRLSDPWRAQDELGFQALVSFDEGVEKLVAWWRAQRKAAAFA